MVGTAVEVKKSLAEIVETDRYHEDPEILVEYARCEMPSFEGKPVSVVKPRSAAEIQEIFRLANNIGGDKQHPLIRRKGMPFYRNGIG